MTLQVHRSLAAGVCWLMLGTIAAAAPMGSEISYQGVLEDAGVSVTGQVDMIFTLYDAATIGNVVGTAALFDGQAGNGPPVDVTDGLFTVAPDFGANVFDGTALWLEVRVRSPHDPTNVALYTPLNPRQPISAAPIALQTRGIFVNENTGKVGIGTSSPGEILEVAKDFPSLIRIALNNPNVSGSTSLSLFEGLAQRAMFWYDNAAAKLTVRTTGTETIGFQIGSAADKMTILATGNVGIGTATPAARLDVAQGNLVVTDAAVTQVQLGGVGPGGEVSVRNDAGTETIGLLGGVSGAEGALRMFNTTSGFESAGINGDFGGHGGRIFTQSENGFPQVTIEPDVSGSGAFVNLRRNDASTGFLFDGNSGGSGNPSLNITGTVSSCFFNANLAGDFSVVLPVNAISAREILDEAAAASINNNTAVTLTGAVDTILSRTITVPADGFVLAIGTCQANALHVTGTTTWANFAVSDTAGVIPSTQDVAYLVPGAYPSATVNRPVTVQAIFPVLAGARTFYFLGDENGGAITCNDMTLSLIYVPTNYGIVVPPLMGPGSADNMVPETAPLSAVDIRAEQIEAEAFHRQRIERELRQMQAQMQALQARLDQVLKEQGLDRRAPRQESTISPITSEKNTETSKLSSDKNAEIESSRNKDAEPEARSVRIEAVPNVQSSRVNGGTR